MLSFRYLTDDQFWFTFFHEAGHLILHGESNIFLEGSDMPSTASEQETEREANEFAEGILFPRKCNRNSWPFHANAREVIRFAVRLGVSPGIIVGQLQHLGRIKHNQFNRLRRRFNWENLT